MKILILSDLHLNTPKGVLKRFDTEDAEAAIDSLKVVVDLEKPEACIIAGDIFNSIKHDGTEIKLIRYLKDKLGSEIRIYVIRGNHDRSEFSTPTNMYDWIELTETPIYLDAAKKITVSGLHFCNTAKHREYLSRKRSDIMVCHFPMAPFNSFNPENISVDDAPADCVVVVGDTHKPDVIMKDDKCVVSPGCLFPANKAELLSKKAGSAYILEIDRVYGELEANLKPVQLDSRFGADLTRLSSVDEILVELRSIDAERPFPANLKPVAFVTPEQLSASAVSEFQDRIELIPVTLSQELSEGSAVDFSGLEGLDVAARIDRILSGIFEGDPDAEAAKDLAAALVISDSPAKTIEAFVSGRK